MMVMSWHATCGGLGGPPCTRRRPSLPKFRLSNLALPLSASTGDTNQEASPSRLSPLQLIGSGPKGSVNAAAVRRLKKAELQEELQLRALQVDGNRYELRERLIQAIKSEQADSAGSAEPQAQDPAQQQLAADVRIADTAQVKKIVNPAQQEGAVSNIADPVARGGGDTSTSRAVTPAAAPTPTPAAAPAATPAAASAAADQHQGAHGQSRAEVNAANLSVTWLGTSSGNPSLRRNVSCIALALGASTYLVDCGEGTSRQVIRASIDPASISGVFISHLHGDHCFGLPGLIELVSESHKGSGTAPESRLLRIQGPPGIQQLVKGALLASKSQLHMKLLVSDYTLDKGQAKAATPVDPTGLISFARLAPDANSRPNMHQSPRGRSRNFQSKQPSLQAHNVPVVPGLVWTIPCEGGLTVTAAQLQHRLPCWGYVFQEAASQGQQGRKVVLLGDTCDSDAIIGPGMGADLVSHEATFAAGMEKKAHVAQHSTAPMAGTFARKIRAHALVLTHFSNRYSNRGEIQGEQLRAGSEGDRQDVLRWLTNQAKEAYGSDRVWAADDFYTFQVRQRFVSAGSGNAHRQ